MTVSDGDRNGAAAAARSAAESYLVAEFGHTNTLVTLYDVADGGYRFVASGSAPTTARAPWYDLLQGLQQAIRQLTAVTGRPLLSKDGTLIRPAREDGAGVDHFGVTISAAEPLRAVTVGLLDNVSLGSVRRALQTIYAQELDSLSLADQRSQQGQADAFLQHHPDIVLIAGGTDGAADERLMNLVDTVAIGVTMLDGSRKPVIVYAGNRNLRPKVTAALGGLTSLHVAENVRPELESESLDDAIRLVREIYDTRKIGTIPGVDEVLNWTTIAPLPTAHAFAGITEYFAALYRGRVLGLDVASDSITLVAAEPDRMRLSVRSDLGTGRPLLGLASKVQPAAFLRWAVPEFSAAALRNLMFDKGLRPHTVPLTAEELQVEQAIVRQLIRFAVRDASVRWEWPSADRLLPFKLLLLRGGALTNAPRAGQALLMTLDGLQPRGIFPVAMDRQGILPAMGLLAAHNPVLVVQVLESGVLSDLGWVIVPEGRAQPGQTVLRVKLNTAENGTLQTEVAFGTLELLPLSPGQTAELVIEPLRRFDIGLGPGRGRRLKVHGGEVGVVIDARGRPLTLPETDDDRRSLLRRWLSDLGG